MKIFNKRLRWETLALTAILGVMVVAFAAMMVIVLTAPPAYVPPADKPAPPDGVGPVRQAKVYRSKPLVIHDFEDAEEPWRKLSEEDPHSSLMVDAPESSGKSAEQELSAYLDMRANMPGSNRKKGRGDSEDEDEQDGGLLSEKKEKVSTGWGWLADDIKKKKLAREEEEKKTEEEEKDPLDPNADAEAGLVGTNGKDKKKDGEKKTVFFMDASYEKTDGYQERDRFAMQDSEPTDPYADPSSDKDSKAAAEKENDTEDKRDQAALMPRESGEREKGLGSRDAFSARAEDTRTFSDDAWGFSRQSEGYQSSYDDARESRLVGDSYGSIAASEDQSLRIVGAADSDSRQLSGAWTGYKSDSMFSSGAGYTPRGVSDSGGNSMFSGAGVFDSSTYSLPAPSESSIDKLSTPSYGSSLGSSALETPRSSSDIAAPRTLPW